MMKIVFLGSGQFGIESLDALHKSRHNLRLVVTQPAHPAGRGRKQKTTDVADWAKHNLVKFIETDNVNSKEIIEKIAQQKPDLIVVIAFGQKVSKDVINIAPKGAINVHASLLPKYRGAAPINWAIINGEKETGISIITLAERMDAGDVLAQARTEISEKETADQLHDRLASLAAPLLLETIDKIEDGSAVYIKQDESAATLAPKLKKSDGFLDFNEPAELLERKIRGFWPWPGGSAIYISKKTGKNERVTIAMSEVIKTPNQEKLPVGTLDENLNIICGQNALKIIKIQPAGKPVLDFRDFANGRSTQKGDLFVKIQ